MFCLLYTSGVDESIWKFAGPAKVFDSQDAACEGILGGKVVSGDVVVITHEGPKGDVYKRQPLDRVCQCSDRDVIHTTFGIIAKRGECDTTGRFQFITSGNHFDSFFCILDIEVVQHDTVDTADAHRFLQDVYKRQCWCCCFLALKPFGYAVSVGKGE